MYNPGGVDYNLGRVPSQLLDHIQRECYQEWMDVRPECCFSPFPRCVAVSIHQPVCDLGALPVFVRRIPRLYHRWSQSHPHHAQRTHHHHPPPTRPSHLLSPDLLQYPNRWPPSTVMRLADSGQGQAISASPISQSIFATFGRWLILCLAQFALSSSKKEN